MRFAVILTAALALALLLSSCDVMIKDIIAADSETAEESTESAETEQQPADTVNEENARAVLATLEESFGQTGDYDLETLPDWFGGMYYENETGRAAVCVTDQGEGFIRDFGSSVDMTVVDLVHVKYSMLTLIDIRELMSVQLEQGNVWELGINIMQNAVEVSAVSEEGADEVRRFLEENGAEQDTCLITVSEPPPEAEPM